MIIILFFFFGVIKQQNDGEENLMLGIFSQKKKKKRNAGLLQVQNRRIFFRSQLALLHTKTPFESSMDFLEFQEEMCLCCLVDHCW